jgi:transcription-repair coupling factor (superfamily II helicase)
MQEIDEMEQELVDRFGPLPRSTENLMYQLHLKVLARDAGVSTVSIEGDRLALQSARGDLPHRDRLHRALRGSASVSRRGVWMPLKRGWRDALVRVLRDMARIQATSSEGPSPAR